MRRNKQRKRFVAILLTLLLCSEAFPFSAYAENEDTNESAQSETVFSGVSLPDESGYQESAPDGGDDAVQKADDFMIGLDSENTEQEYSFSFEYDERTPETVSYPENAMTVGSSEESSLDTDPVLKKSELVDGAVNGEAVIENYVLPENDVELIETLSDYMPAGFDTDTSDDGTIATASWDEGIFPEGTSMQIEEADIDFTSGNECLSLSDDVQILDGFAVEISFFGDQDEGGLQPYEYGSVHIELELPYAIYGDTFYLVHIMDDGKIEYIPSHVSVQLMNDGRMQATGVSFDACSFSVYALISAEQTGKYARRTYEYYVDSDLFASQTVTKLDTLADPGIPALSEDEEFMGWYLTGDESRNPVTLDELRSDLAGADIHEGETVSLKAIIRHTYMVSYYDEDDAVVKSVKVYDGEDFVVSENYEPKLPERVFKGWKVGESLYSVGETIYKIKDDLILKPALKGTFLVTFNINCEDESAPEIAPIMVEEGADISTYLPDTEKMIRPGYYFDGWFKGIEENGSITLEENAVSGGPVTGAETLYAKWTAGEQTAFTVKIWKQSIEDDYRIGLTAESAYYDEDYDMSTQNKEYLYDCSVVLFGPTGAEVSSVEDFTNCLTPEDGFYLAGIKYLDGDGNENAVITSNGKTVVNIFFDRQILSLSFNGKRAQYVEDAEAITNVYGKAEGSDEYFPVFFLCTATEAGDNTQSPQYGTSDGTIYYKIYYRKAYTFVQKESSNNTLYRINDEGTKYEKIYFFADDGNYHYENNINSPVYSGIKYGTDISAYRWVKANSSYGVEYNGIRYLEPVYHWYKGNSTASEQYIGERYQMEVEDYSSTFIGLFGQDFHKYNYVWPVDTVWNEIPFINSFTDLESFEEEADDETTRNWTINAESTNTESSTITVIYYCQGSNGTSYERFASIFYYLKDNTEYYASNSFPGMYFSEYIWSNSTDDPGDAVTWLTGEKGENGKTSCGGKEYSSVLHLRYIPKCYQLIFKDGQFSGEQSVLKTLEIQYGSSLSEYLDQAPAGMSKAGCYFTGWFCDPQCTERFSWTGKMYDSNLTVYAGWEKCSYRVVIHLCDDAASPAVFSSERSFLVAAGGKIEYTTPSRQGYRYVGLFTDPDYEQEISPSTAVTAGISGMDSNYPLSEEYINGLEENGVLLYGPENEADHVAGKLNLYVKWEKQESVSIRIVYDPNGGSNAPVDPADYYGQDYAAAHSVCTAPNGKAFLCWTYTDATTGRDVEVYPGHFFPLQQAETTIKEDENSRIVTITLKAKYVETQNPGEVTVIFDPNGGIGSYRISVPANQPFAVPSQESTGILREGYRLAGWNSEADGSGESFKIGDYAAANMQGHNMLYAVWDQEISLYFTVNQTEFGSLSEDSVTIAQHADESISIMAMPAEHCVFICWVLNSETVSTDNILNLSMPEGGWTPAGYQAVFERETLSVSFDANAENVENSPGVQRIPYGERAIRPENPMRNGFRFAGWEKDGNDYDFSLPVTKNLTLTAQWIQEYRVSYSVTSAGNGTSIDIAPNDDRGYIEGETVRVKADPLPPEGYEGFAGWNTHDARILNDCFIMPANNVTLTGTLSPITYTISYELDGGTVEEDNPTDYTVESDTLILKQPTRVGYIFIGWTGSNGAEAQIDVTVPTGSSGNRNYTATWSPAVNTPYHVVVHYPDGWTMPETIDGATVKPEENTATYACTGTTGSLVNTSAYQTQADPRLAYDPENPNNVLQGMILPDGTLVLHVYLKRAAYHYTVHFCLKDTETKVATQSGVTEPDANGTSVITASLENAVFENEYTDYASLMLIIGDSEVTVSADHSTAVLPVIIEVSIDRMDNRELYKNGGEQYGFSASELAGTGFVSPSEDGHMAVSGLLPGDRMTLDFTPASGTEPGTYSASCNGASFTNGENTVMYYRFTGFDPQSMGQLTVLKTVTVIWENGTSILWTDPYVPPGSVPVYGGETPEQAADARYMYTFSGWDPEISAVSRDTSYTAVFTRSFRQYNVTFENWDGSVAWKGVCNYGDTPVYGGGQQVKPEDDEYSYVFQAWTPAISEVEDDIIYRPAFTKTPRQYNVTYQLDGEPHGSVVSKAFGEHVTLKDDPLREGFNFSGWSSEDVVIDHGAFTMPAKNVVICGSYSEIEKQTFDPDDLTEEQKAAGCTSLIYNGTEQSLMTAPDSFPEGYSGVCYSTDGGESWHTAVPKGVEAGEYKVLVKYIGDSRHESFITDEISITIGKAVITTLRATTYKELVYTGDELALLASLSGVPEGASIEYLICNAENHVVKNWTTVLPSAVVPGTYRVYYRIDGGNNYRAVPQTIIGNNNSHNTVIVKADQTMPRKPSAVAYDAHSISVYQTVGGQEYLIMPVGQTPLETDWAANGMISSEGKMLVFNSLTACMDYVVFTRKAATDCYNASDFIASDTVKTPKELQSKPTSKIITTVTCTSITVKPAYALQEYSLDLGNSWVMVPEGRDELTFHNLKPDTEYKLSTRMAETATAFASEGTEPITIKTMTGEIITEVRKGDKSVPNISVTGLNEQLAKKLNNPDELEMVLKGNNETVYLVVTNTTSCVSATDKVLIDKAAKEKNMDAVVCMCLDISLYKQLEGKSPVAITSIGTDSLEITLTIPEQFRDNNSGIVRSFYIVRIHSGDAEVIQPTVSGNNIVFSTDRFSSYALFYVDRSESLSGTDGTDATAGTTTLASMTAGTNGPTTPTAASVSVTGTTASTMSDERTGTSATGSTGKNAELELAERSKENNSAKTENMENPVYEMDVAIQGKDVSSEKGSATNENAFDSFFKSFLRVVFLLPFGLLFIILLVNRSRRKRRLEE